VTADFGLETVATAGGYFSAYMLYYYIIISYIERKREIKYTENNK